MAIQVVEVELRPLERVPVEEDVFVSVVFVQEGGSAPTCQLVVRVALYSMGRQADEGASGSRTLQMPEGSALSRRVQPFLQIRAITSSR